MQGASTQWPMRKTPKGDHEVWTGGNQSCCGMCAHLIVKHTPWTECKAACRAHGEAGDLRETKDEIQVNTSTFLQC